MDIQLRRDIERQIVKAAVDALIAFGYQINVCNGEVVALRKLSTDADAVMAELFACDEEQLIVYTMDGQRAGTVLLVYGNDGWDVIADNTDRLEDALAPATKLAEEIEDRYAA